MRSHILLILGASCCAADLPAELDCRRSNDCETAVCVSGRCQSLPGPDVWWPPADLGQSDPAPADSAPASRHCAGAATPDAARLALNEALVNVPTGPDGDANGDGVRDPYEDEFVELVNVGARPLDLTGVRISSGDSLKHTFEPLCLVPMDSVVVFGGGAVGASVVGNAVTSDRRFAFANDGGSIRVTGPGGLIAQFDYVSAPDASFTRAPQLTGADWVSHLSISPRRFSPGACPDGSPLVMGCGPAPDEPDAGGD